jgi:uncharacterized protein YndB with AHSA1/START domain
MNNIKNCISISATIAASVQKVWDAYTLPEHITQWNQASADWHCPKASNDLRVGGRLTSRMEARDGSAQFDFGGTYTVVELYKRLAFTMDDERTVDVAFKEEVGQTVVTVVFEAEKENSHELQKQGWQSILNNFKSYVLDSDTKLLR